MKFGSINCKCGNGFYFESVAQEVKCPYCDESYSTDPFSEKVELIEEFFNIEDILQEV
jgi:hypothetical protein